MTQTPFTLQVRDCEAAEAERHRLDVVGVLEAVQAHYQRRLGLPEEVAAAVAFFASEQASFITGQTLSVSGGLVMN